MYTCISFIKLYIPVYTTVEHNQFWSLFLGITGLYTTNITVFMINVLYSSLDVICFMFPQTIYEYDLFLLRQNDSILSTYVYYIIIVCFLYHLNVHGISYIPREGSLLEE